MISWAFLFQHVPAFSLANAFGNISKIDQAIRAGNLNFMRNNKPHATKMGQKHLFVFY